MKVFTMFMTILMLITGFDLCKDDDSYACKENINISTTRDDAHEEDSPCAPFCSCARCPFSVVIPTTFRELLADVITKRTFPGISPATPIEVSATVWQPPKSQSYS